MKVVVIGGTGLIGSKLVEKLNAHGHDAIPAALQTGMNTLTNEGVEDAVTGAEVLVDVSNSPSFEDEDVMSFFVTSTSNLLRAAKAAGVAHYVALSVVGTGRLPGSGYLRAKAAQEKLIGESGLPYSIVRATQFFEFLVGIANGATSDGVVHLPPVLFQPMAADDVAAALGRVSVGTPLDGVQEVGGPDKRRMDHLVGVALGRAGDDRPVHAEEHATYFGTELDDGSLVPGPDAVLAETSYEDWLTAGH
jgi:uncharacterized protein YbjT (DUF2867 family)